MPNSEVIIIQTQPEWLHHGNGAANDAALLSFEEWQDLHGDHEPDIESAEDLQRWWDRLEDEADWRMCQRMGVGL